MAPDAAPLLEARGLIAGYRGSSILHDVHLAVRPGGITGIIGPNGAGKSTLLKTLLGYLRPSAGEVRFAGRALDALPAHERIRAGLAYMAQSSGHFPSLTVLENLRVGAFLVRDERLRAERTNAVLRRFPAIAERARQPAGLLSGGEARMLEIARMLMTAPRLAILDEPSVGLAPKLVDLVYGHIRTLRDEGVTFLVVEQNVRKLLTVADFVYALENGRNRYEGTPQTLQDQGRLASLYLGTGSAGAASAS